MNILYCSYYSWLHTEFLHTEDFYHVNVISEHVLIQN